VSTTAGVQTRYLHKDALGSVDLITDATANVVDRRSFDAWGKLRNLTWKDNEGIANPLYLTQLPFTNKGYTGHENIQEVDLIHMNGRVYDATLARFMSADPHIQEGALTQSYNRYSYVMNNPMKYTDPSGYFFKSLFRAIKKAVKSVVKSKLFKIVATVVLAVVTYGAASAWAAGLMAGTNIGCSMALSGVIAGAAGGAAAGFVAGASLTAMNGGSVRESLKAGLKGGVSGAITGGVAGSYGKAWSWQRVGASSVAGGASSEIQGGRFKDGFKFSLAVSMLTYASHEMRKSMIRQSKIDPRNASGKSVGFKGDGFKLGGGRYNSILGEKQVRSPLGGIQGDVGQLSFLGDYAPGSWQDHLVEAYAGPHDYLNSGYWYNSVGNIKTGLSSLQQTFGEALNYANVAVAKPFGAASVIPSYMYPLIEKESR
jgi:RHS repeat-associated protein